MCLNNLFTERGIKGRHGYLAEWYTEQPNFLVRVPDKIAPLAVLFEPMAVAEKGIDQVRKIQSRLS